MVRGCGGAEHQATRSVPVTAATGAALPCEYFGNIIGE